MLSRYPWTESFWREVSRHPQHWNSLHAIMAHFEVCSTLLMNIPDIVSWLTRCLRLPRKHLVTTGIQILTMIQENLWYTINWMHFICQYLASIVMELKHGIIVSSTSSRPGSHRGLRAVYTFRTLVHVMVVFYFTLKFINFLF